MNVTPGPLVRRKSGCILVKSDAEAVGREAARALLAQGAYKSYAFAGYRTDDDWSRERGRAYRDSLQEAGFVGRMFDADHFNGKTEDRATLIKWLKSLPKPCGILAACDDRAYEIVDACNDCGIRIPSEIGILGVNNDPLLCENASPRLSSVQPDFRREGYLAAQTLDRLMRRGKVLGVRGQVLGKEKSNTQPNTYNLTPNTFLVGIRQIVHRESTYPLSNSGILVQKALSFIERNALRKFSVEDVARHLKISRSLLDLRFRELQHDTVHNAIIRARLEEIRRRLRSSTDTIEKISLDCGWANVNSLKNAFKRTFGCSMREWQSGGR